MRLASWCAVCAIALIIVGLTPALFVQLELASPGVQVFKGQVEAFNIAVAAHGLLSAACAPLAVAALGFATAAEAGTSRLWSAASVLALGCSLLLTIACVAIAAIDTPIRTKAADLAVIPSALVLLLSGVVVAATFKSARAIPIFLWLSAPMLAFAALLKVIMQNSGVDTALYDTYYEVASTHAIGVAIVLLTLAIFTAYVGKNAPNQPGGWFGVLFGGLVFAVGVLTVMLTASLGLTGMPRRYYDYPAAFASRQLELAICGAAVVALIVAAFGSLALTHFRRRGKDRA